MKTSTITLSNFLESETK